MQPHLKDRASLQLYSCDINGVSIQQWLNKLLWPGARKAVLLFKVRKRRNDGPFHLMITHLTFTGLSKASFRECHQWCDSVADETDHKDENLRKTNVGNCELKM